jgi:hypothetical protein
MNNATRRCRSRALERSSRRACGAPRNEARGGGLAVADGQVFWLVTRWNRLLGARNWCLSLAYRRASNFCSSGKGIGQSNSV